MEQYILANTETIINSFNELLMKTINNEKDKLIEDFKAQIKTDVVQKLNGNTDELFTDKNINIAEIKNEVVKDLGYSANVNYTRSKFDQFINNIKFDFRPKEYIVNYKYQTIIAHNSSEKYIKRVFLLIITNYGSIIIFQFQTEPNIYVGKYRLNNEILYIFNNFVDILFGNGNKTQSAYTDQNYNSCSSKDEFKIANINHIIGIISIIEKFQIDYYAKPLIGYHAQQLIDENNKLKEENNKTKLIYEQIKQEKENIQQLQTKLDSNMEKYNNIKDMEKKWNEIKDYKIKLDILSDKIKVEKDEFEKEKKKFEEEKNKFTKSHIEIDIKNSKLNNDFLNFVNDETISENQTIMINSDSVSLYEKIKKDPLILKDINDNNKTESLCILAVEENIYALEYVPTNMLKDIYMYLLKEHYNIFNNIPEHLITQEFCNIAVDINVNNISNIPEQFKTEDLCNIVIAQIDELESCCDGLIFFNIPNKYKTKELCEYIVQRHGCEIDSVPDELKTKELCELAVKNDWYALQYIPDILKTKTICELAVKNEGRALQYVPDNLKTKEICEFAIINNGYALQYVPDNLKTKELCILAVKNNSGTIWEVTKFNKNEIYELAHKI
ncbi:protein of unknown function DUF4116 [Klosneuvirus KNV1]|uniref:DUF4116 domain-containing protein n=1 Tax=Klosneuvirus KNV1 TaxID=1977640 RepID=A0A1V0SL87_9VIRU|nr:protein of unknown function DUF4116 [Klosneuvirus KNV1]